MTEQIEYKGWVILAHESPLGTLVFMSKDGLVSKYDGDASGGIDRVLTRVMEDIDKVFG